MSYNYETEKQALFTEEGQETFIKLRDGVLAKVKETGAITMGAAMIGTGSSWTLMACVHRMVELGDLESVWDKGAGQHEVFRVPPKY